MKRFLPLAYSLTLLLSAARAQETHPLPAAAGHAKIDGRFYLLRDRLGAERTIAPAEQSAAGSIRFLHPPAAADLERLAAMGIRFREEEGKGLHSATVYPAEIPFASLAELEGDPSVAFVQCGWRPMRVPPLWVSRPQIQAEEAWGRTDALKRNLTGQGILVADFDTGVDFFHPMMWRADGDTLDWIDVDGNGAFTPGVDAVDLNGNGKADSTERLNYVEIAFPAFGNDSSYTSDMDWLYNDANRNGTRDFGTAAGFTEASPTYGEQWFVSLDANGNNKLDPGEKLVALRTCKVRAIRAPDGTVRRRGVDLIQAGPDNGPYGGHGTAVCGILNGGVPFRKKLTGIAPDAEVIVAEIAYNQTPRFYTDLAEQMAWAKNEGAQVFLTEDGEWVWEFLDGSSNEEIMMNELARDENIIFTTPLGNLTGGRMMKSVTLPKQDTISVRLVVPPRMGAVWPTFLWKGAASDVEVRLESPAGRDFAIPFDDRRFLEDSTSLFSDTTVSPRSTVRASIEMSPVDSGLWVFHFRNRTASDIRMYCMVGDNFFSWYGYAHWERPTEDNTVTWPATADSVIGIGAYDPRSGHGNYFSGRGKRLDGEMPADVTCPGSTVYSIGRNNAYTPFGGTSSAGPHGAGAAAILRQMYPNRRWKEIESWLRQGALADSNTGTVPNSTWGWGKIRIVDALKTGPTAVREVAAVTSSLRLEQNYPNPFTERTILRFGVSGQGIEVSGQRSEVSGQGSGQYLSGNSSSLLSLKIYDLLGREVLDLTEAARGRDVLVLEGNRLPGAGIYLCRLATAGGTRSMLLTHLK